MPSYAVAALIVVLSVALSGVATSAPAQRDVRDVAADRASDRGTCGNLRERIAEAPPARSPVAVASYAVTRTGPGLAAMLAGPVRS